MALNDDKKKRDPGYAAGAKVRSLIAAPTAWGAMGQSYAAQGQAASQAAAPVRGFAQGLAGVEPATRQTPKAPPAAPKAPAVAAPSFANVTGGANTSYGRPANPASRPGTPQGAGAPSAAGAGSASYYIGGDGRRRTVNSDGTIAGTNANAMTVNRQNFGNPVVPQAQASIARPGVASTFGLSVNDPRLNDQTPAIASPNAAARGFRLASADTMSRYHANKEDREATQKLLGDIDTQMFMARGKNTPSARRLMEGLASAKAQAIGNMAANTTAQANENTRGQFGLANTGLEQAGQTQRQQMAGDVTREGNFLDYDATNRATDASLIARPTMQQAADGSLYSVTGTNAAAVIGPDGQQIRAAVEAPQQRNYGAESDNKLFADLVSMKVDGQGNPLPNAVELAVADMQKYKAAYLGSGQQAKPPAGYPNAKQAPDGKWYVQKDGATYLVN